MALITQRDTAFKKALEDPGTFATCLLAILIDEYTTDVFEWDPRGLAMDLKADFHAEIPDVNKDKIGALMVALTTNQFYQNPEIFLNTCRALCHGEADFAMFSPLTPEELAWGVTEVMLNNPPDPELGNNEFSEEVASMVGMLLTQQGVLKAPKTLQFATYSTENPAFNLDTMFSDDETMLQAVLTNQDVATNEVDAHTKETLRLMKAQLDALPLSGRVPAKGAGAQKAPAR